MLGFQKNTLALFPITILLSTIFVMAPLPVFADPPAPCTDCGDVQLPQVFCFRITDIRADKSDPDNETFTFEFEVLNWSNRLATDVHISLAEPDTSGVRFIPTSPDPAFPLDLADGVDEDGRPLIPWPVGAPIGPEDDDNDGILDPGEDDNGDERLTNDLIPGNQNIPNEFEMTDQTATSITWEAPFDFEFIDDVDYEFSPIIPLAHAGGFGCEGDCGGIEPIDLIGIATFQGQQAVNQAIPGELFEEYFVDANGVISDPEVIDNGDNVRDGFIFTVTDFGEGETFQLNWFLSTPDFEGGSIPIGTTGFGNTFGFGVINFAREDSGGLPGPVYVGNTGFIQSPLMFYDSVYIVPDPAMAGAEAGAGITAPFINPDDNIFNSQPNTVLLQSQVGGAFMPVDTTSLMLLGVQGTASWLIPVLVSAIGIGIVIVTRKSN